MPGNILMRLLLNALLVLMLGRTGYAVYVYNIDFKSDRQVSTCLENLSVAGIKQVTLTNGILKLEILPDNWNSRVSVSAGWKLGPGMYDQPQRADFNEYGEVVIKARVTAQDLDRKTGYSFKLWLGTDKGDVIIPAAVVDLSDRHFQEYRFLRKETPAWRNALKVKSVSFLLSSTNVTYSSLVFEIESIRLNPLVNRVVEDKLALVGQTKTLYVESSLDIFKRQGLDIKDLASQVDDFKARIEQAKECHQKKDYEGAYKYIVKAEDLDRVFYPRVRLGWDLLAIGERLEGLEAIRKLYAEKNGKEFPEAGKIRKEKEYKRCFERLAAGKYGIEDELKKLTAGIDKEYQELDKASPYGLGLRMGLSQSSFGRFGWLPADFDEGLLVYNLLKTPDTLGKDFDQNTKVILSSKEYHESGKILREEKKDVTWVSFRRDVVFKGNNGKEIHWNYLCSLLAPGVLLETDASSLLLSQKRRKGLAPDWIVVPDGKSGRVYELTEGADIKPEMKENWLLLLWPGQERYNPVLLTFEKRPELLKKEGKSLSIIRAGGIGHVGITDYSGMFPFDYAGTDGWRQSVPGNVLERCRLISRVMSDYPVTCREFYAVDETKREILIVNETGYHQIRDEWQTPLTEYTPIPPLVSYLKDKKYSSISVSRTETDFGISTKYGPYRAVAGSRLEYRIPLPDFNHRCYLKAEGANLDPQVKLYGAVFSRLPVGSVLDAPAWNVLDKQKLPERLECERKLQSKFRATKYSSQWGITDGYPGLAFGQSSNDPPYFRAPMAMSDIVDRVEPFVGQEYVAIGWGEINKGRESMGPIAYGDMANGVGITTVEALYYYGLYSGDWEYIRESWPFLKRLCLIMGRMDDWADLTLTYDERIADNYVDTGADCLKVPVCFMKMAQALGDTESYRWAAYIAAKDSLSRNSMFIMDEYMQGYSSMARGGDYCLGMGVGEMGCGIGDYQNMSWQDIVDSHKGKARRLFGGLFQNIWTGCGPMMIEDYDAWLQYVPEFAGRLAFEKFPAHFPDWDVSTMNIDLSRYLMARIYLDDADDVLWDYFPGCGNVLGGSAANNTSAQKINFAMLQGRNTPVYLVDWQPNRLVQGTYDMDGNQAKVEIEAVQPGTVKLKSLVQPAAIRDNDKLLTARGAHGPPEQNSKVDADLPGRARAGRTAFYEYDAARKILTIRIDKGWHTLALDYTGWTRLQRKKITVDLEPIRQAMAKGNLISEEERSYKTTNLCLTLDISRQANMGFVDEKAGDQKGGLFDEGRSLTNLPAGQGKFAGIPFTIIDPARNNGRGCIVLKGQAKPFFPGKAEGIEVRRKFKNLYVLNNACYCASDDAVIYRIRLNYGDGTQGEMEVMAGETIKDWFFNPRKINDLSGAKVGWQGKATEKNSKGAVEEIPVALYCAMLANPNPGKEVQTIDIISNNTKAVPAIFGITVEE